MKVEEYSSESFICTFFLFRDLHICDRFIVIYLDILDINDDIRI